jgi:hypothetical protein
LANPEELEHCAFCGATAAEGARLVDGGGIDDAALPVVHICSDCVDTCAEALRTERRLREARASNRPPAMPAGAVELGQISGWAHFVVDGVALEWCAERTLAMSQAEVTVVRVRRKGQRQSLAMETDAGGELDPQYAVQASYWLRENEDAPLSGPSEGAVATSFVPLERDGEAFEWCTERVIRLRSRRVVLVHVRNPITLASTTMEFDYRTQPTVDEAVMAASVALGALAAPRDDGV